MITAGIVMVAVSMVLGLIFVITLGPPWKSENPSMTWLQALLAWVALQFDVALFLSAFHVVVPIWVVLLILLSQDVVFGWRLWLLLKKRRALHRTATQSPVEEPEPPETLTP
jgi:hypothetical protein